LPQATLTSSIRAEKLLVDEFDVPEDSIHPLPDCVDLERFNAAKFSNEAKLGLRRRYGIPETRPIVAYLGLLADYQGTHHLVQAAAYLKQKGEDVHFLVMGFPKVDLYRAMADGLGVGDRMTFTGKVDYRDAPLYLSLGDIAVSAKMSATEGSGKVLNYMAMGQPVVAYDTVVHREYLAEHGVFTPVGAYQGLAEAVRELVHDPERRHCLGQALRQRARDHYSWENAGKKIGDLYESLIIRGRKNK
jgi:glycosyltransferase involved in cell wall biosynthesis